jgi:polar amino acid transport system substrate-binding protein
MLTKMRTLAGVKDPDEVDSPKWTLTALKGSTSQAFAEREIAKAKLIPAKDYDEGVRLVVEGKADAFIADHHICALSVLRYPDKDLVSLADSLTYEPIGVGLPAGDPLLVNWVENYLSTLMGSDELNAMKKRWFENLDWLGRLP